MKPITITIERPQLAKRLAEDAERHGLDVADYAQHLLENTLASQTILTEQADASKRQPAVSSDQVSPDQTPTQSVPLGQWLAEFDGWVASHTNREPLPEAAFERESFYPQEWREQAA